MSDKPSPPDIQLLRDDYVPNELRLTRLLYAPIRWVFDCVGWMIGEPKVAVIPAGVVSAVVKLSQGNGVGVEPDVFRVYGARHEHDAMAATGVPPLGYRHPVKFFYEAYSKEVVPAGNGAFDVTVRYRLPVVQPEAVQ